MKRVGLFLSILFLILTGGSLVGKASFSNHTPSETEPIHPSLTHSSFKMSGVLKAVDLVGPSHSRLILVGENGLEKTVSIASDATLVLEDAPLQIDELKPGDVVDLDLEFDEKAQQPLVRRLSVIVRDVAEPTPQERELLKDQEFE